MPGQRPEAPVECKSGEDLPKRSGSRVSCHEGIIKLQSADMPCLPGAEFNNDCNRCVCGNAGEEFCTLKGCSAEQPGAVDKGDTALCEGQTECPADCGEAGRDARCLYCQCGSGPLAPGEQVVGIDEQCPAGLTAIRFQAFTKVCGPSPTAVSFALNSGPVAGCPHGPAFIDECNNDCNCVNGKVYSCTKKACKPGEQPEKPRSCGVDDNLPKRTGRRVFCHKGIIKTQSLDAPCLPGSVYKADCNTCVCGDNGVAGCTLKLCSKDESGCPHGKEFIDECGNDCNCVDNKFYGCTRKACKAGQTSQKPMSCNGTDNLPERSKRRVFCHDKIVKVQNEDAKCLPGALFKMECNNCVCSDNGVAGCTLKLCLPEQKGCAHGPEFIDECGNDCRCVDNKFYGCTFKACREGQMSQKPMSCKGSDGLPNRSRRRVFCHENIVKVQDTDAKCLPGAAFKNECNSCVCSDTGVAGCTLKLCI
ncbi:SCO-spondin-like isoform X2 [Pollicipes pollicipes]|uniref:SCO-spondin-like isoform X2 n=1 Tax=Pollicipes pollicipes TaxID=41117 RepID=UPI00188583E9|nr:SCO-spondin-like isoform X2 [Pollicipes pollicipes]